MNQKPLVIGIGELLWDIFPDQKKMGGAPANFAYHVSKSGIESLVISAVGADQLGKELLSILQQAGLNFDVQQLEYPTGTVQVTLDEKGIPQYEICQPVAWDYIHFKQEWESIAQSASAVCFGSLAQRHEISGKTIRNFLGFVPETAFKVFDINLRQHYYSQHLIHESLQLCNILKINDEELAEVARLFNIDGSQDEICRTLIDAYHLKLLVLTCGTNGSYLYTSDTISYKPTPKVKVADTVGAGDSFTAAIVTGLIKQETLEDIHDKAVKLSAFVCTQNGAMPEYNWKNMI